MKIFDPPGINNRVGKTSRKRNLTLESGDCLSVEGKVRQRTNKTQGNFFSIMDSIAYGVEAWLEERTDYSRKVVETTQDIARKLGLPEAEIDRWSACRFTRYIEKDRVIKSLLKGAQVSPLADQVEDKEHKGKYRPQG
jgi:response regulator RpfG family c-di-GMP phosphodiesterase